MSTLNIRDMTPEDIGACCRLSELAGWNQIEADWHRLIALCPRGCIVGERDGQVIASATLAVYGQDIAWVGMLLVDPAARGGGIGTTMFNAMCDRGPDLGIPVLGLDATDMGEPIYRKVGFVGEIGVDRWVSDRPAGDLTLVTDMTSDRHGGSTVSPIHDEDWAELIALDALAVHADRRALLEVMHQESGATGRRARGEAGSLLGFGLARRGRTASHVGPIVTESPEVGHRLLRELIASRAEDAPDMPVYVDVLRDHPAERELARIGFSRQRRLLRMTRPGLTHALMTAGGSQVVAISSFELG